MLLNVLPPIELSEIESLPPSTDTAAMEQERENSVQEELRQLAAETSAGVCGCVQPMVVHGNPSIEILAKAEELHASLIVLGSTDRSKLGNLTRDRTVYRVLAHANCPVLTLREAPLAEAEEREAFEAAHQ